MNTARKREEYPAGWRIWEDEILAPLLKGEPDRVDFTSYRILENFVPN